MTQTLLSFGQFVTNGSFVLQWVLGSLNLFLFLFTILNLFHSFSFYFPTCFNIFWMNQEVPITVLFDLHWIGLPSLLNLSCCTIFLCLF